MMGGLEKSTLLIKIQATMKGKNNSFHLDINRLFIIFILMLICVQWWFNIILI